MSTNEVFFRYLASLSTSSRKSVVLHWIQKGFPPIDPFTYPSRFDASHPAHFVVYLCNPTAIQFVRVTLLLIT